MYSQEHSPLRRKGAISPLRRKGAILLGFSRHSPLLCLVQWDWDWVMMDCRSTKATEKKETCDILSSCLPEVQMHTNLSKYMFKIHFWHLFWTFCSLWVLQRQSLWTSTSRRTRSQSVDKGTNEGFGFTGVICGLIKLATVEVTMLAWEGLAHAYSLYNLRPQRIPGIIHPYFNNSIARVGNAIASVFFSWVRHLLLIIFHMLQSVHVSYS